MVKGDNGFTPPLAARAYATLARFVLGFAIQLTSPTGQQSDDTRLSATVTVADSMPVPPEDEFAFGLKLILNGLDQMREGSV